MSVSQLKLWWKDSGENPELYIDEHDIINSKVIFKNSTNR